MCTWFYLRVLDCVVDVGAIIFWFNVGVNCVMPAGVVCLRGVVFAVECSGMFYLRRLGFSCCWFLLCFVWLV